MKKASARAALWLALVLVLLAALPVMAESGDPFGKYEEPISIATLSTDTGKASVDYDSSNPARKSASENIWIDAYRDYLNIDVNRIIAEDQTALSARLNTAMASGDLPDFMVVNKSMFYVLAENGVLMDLADVYAEWGHSKNLEAVVNSNPSVMRTGMYDGEMLAMPGITNAYIDSSVMWIRQDWLDKVGMEVPTTIDELTAVAKAFQDAKLGGENTLGIGVTEVDAAIIAAYGAVLNTWEEQEDGTYIFGNVKDEVKDGLLKLQEYYRDGIIKSDFAVTYIINEEVANGTVGIVFRPTYFVSIRANLVNDPEADWVPARIPTLDGEPVKQWTKKTADNFYVVNANCEHPEALFKMIELELYMTFEARGEERETYYTAPDGYNLWNYRVFRNITRADNNLRMSEVICDAYAKGEASVEDPLINPLYQDVLAGMSGDRERYSTALSMLIGYPIIQELATAEEEYLVGAYDGPITESMALYQNTINEALNNAMLKVIMGEDISVFEEAVDTWYATGGQQITDDVTAYYQSMK